MAKERRDRLTEQLCASLLSLKTSDEIYRFLGDVATISETRALAQRLEIARLLSEGHTYPQIVRQTGTSTATISRIRKYLEYGADGYRTVLERIGKEA